MEIKENLRFCWHESTETFFHSYYGNPLMYWHETIGEWVSPEDASMYPSEITDVSNADWVTD